MVSDIKIFPVLARITASAIDCRLVAWRHFFASSWLSVVENSEFTLGWWATILSTGTAFEQAELVVVDDPRFAVRMSTVRRYVDVSVTVLEILAPVILCRKARPYRADLSLFLNVPVVTVKSEIAVRGRLFQTVGEAWKVFVNINDLMYLLNLQFND